MDKAFYPRKPERGTWGLTAGKIISVVLITAALAVTLRKGKSSGRIYYAGILSAKREVYAFL